MKKSAFFAVLVLLLAMIRCEKEGDEGIVESRRFSKESHHAGEDCMQCHDGNTAEAPRFTAAGTVYKPGGEKVAANGKITLYTRSGAQGDVVIVIPVDARGNFYTNRPINWGNGLYPVVDGFWGARTMMSSSITRGNCNSCHTDSGNPTNRIEI